MKKNWLLQVAVLGGALALTADPSPTRNGKAALLSSVALLLEGAEVVPDIAPPATKTPDVVFVPTPQKVVDRMLALADVKTNDVLYDLGCGDGRIVVTAAKRYGIRAVGFDIDPRRVQESLENVRSNRVEHLVTIRQQDIFTLDLREASVVTLYLLPQLNVRLMPQLAKLRPGSRILSHDFDMRGAKPVHVERLTLDGATSPEEDYIESEHTIYKWTVPWVAEEAESKP